MTHGRGRAAVLAFAVAAATLAAAVRVRTDDPVSSSVRFTGDIVRIFDRKCQPCHAANGLAMPLSNYRDVRAWGRAIREEIVEQRMPPWTAARGFGRFRGDLSLSARETITVLSWIDGGMPRGDDKDLPPIPAATPAIAPDVRVALPPQTVPAKQEEVVRRVSIAVPPAAAGRRIARAVLIPGAPQVLRGAHIETAGASGPAQWLGAWLPWQHESAPPGGHAFGLPRDGRLTVELHYRGTDTTVVDNAALELHYAESDAAAIDEVTVGPAVAQLAHAAAVWAIVPSPGTVARSLQVTARRPDGSTEILVWMPQLHREWPQALLLEAPLPLPAGTTVSIVAHPADAGARARLSLLR